MEVSGGDPLVSTYIITYEQVPRTICRDMIRVLLYIIRVIKSYFGIMQYVYMLTYFVFNTFMNSRIRKIKIAPGFLKQISS